MFMLFLWGERWDEIWPSVLRSYSPEGLVKSHAVLTMQLVAKNTL